MGMKMIKAKASEELSESWAANGLNYDEVEQDDIELLKQETSLDYLCNLPPHRWVRFSPLLNIGYHEGIIMADKWHLHIELLWLLKQEASFDYLCNDFVGVR